MAKRNKKNNRSKREVASDIKDSISSGDFYRPSLKDESSQDIELAKTIEQVSVQIETLSKAEQDFFKDLINELKKIPESNNELEKKHVKILDDLVKAAAVIKKLSSEQKHEFVEKKLQEVSIDIEKREKLIKESLDDSPKTLKERVGQKMYGIDPREMRQKGFFKSFISQAKRGFYIRDEEEPSEAKKGEDEQLEFDLSRPKPAPESGEQLGLFDSPALPKRETIAEKMNATSAANKRVHSDLLEGLEKTYRTYNEGNTKRKRVPTKKEEDKKKRKRNRRQKEKDSDSRDYSRLTAGSTDSSDVAQGTPTTSAQLDAFDTPADTKPSAPSVLSGMVERAKKQRDEWKEYQARSFESVSADAQLDSNTASVATSKENIVVKKLEELIDVTKRNDNSGGAEGGVSVDVPSRGSRFFRGGRRARAGARTATSIGRMGLAGIGTSIGAAAATAIGGTVAGGIIGDQFNTSVEDGGSGNLKDWWRNTKLGGLRSESIAEREGRESAMSRGDELAKQRGFANFEAMKSHNQKMRESMVQANKDTSLAIESNSLTAETQKPTVINNIVQQAPAAPQQPQIKPMNEVRSTDNSFIRFQNKRVTRVL